MRCLILIALLAAAGCASTSYTETEDAVTIHRGFGGQMRATAELYRGWRGKRLIVDGQVISADAFFAFGHPDVCYTGRAVWSPHAVSWFALVPSKSMTERAAEMLPAALEEWFLARLSRYDPAGFEYVTADQLEEIWPEGACRGGY